MTKAEADSELEKLSAKFALLKRMVGDWPEAVQFYERAEGTLNEVVQRYGPKKVIFRSANSECRVWVRDLFPTKKKAHALAELEAIDERFGSTPVRRTKKK